MTENQSDHQSDKHAREGREGHEDKGGDGSLLGNLRQAGASLGGVFSEFTGNFRADREADQGPAGEHALHDPAEERETAGQQLRAAGEEARQKWSEGSGFGAVRDAAGAFTGRAENIVRDVAGSVGRAADATWESDATTEARSAVTGAYESARGRLDGAVSSVRDRLDRGEDKSDSDKDSAADVETEPEADIIEGEVVSSETTDTPVDDGPDQEDNKPQS